MDQLENKIVPMGSKTRHGTVEGVQFMNGERYYFLMNKGSVAYLPAYVVERDFFDINERLSR